jgi:predicted acylesterase/phospholipase RssA
MVKNIIFSGAGFKCWAYIGTLRALEEYPFQGIEQVIGVSAGAIFGLFYVLGIRWDFILDFFMDLNFKEVMDIDIDNVLTQQSVLAGIKFTE